MSKDKWAPHSISGRGKVLVCTMTIYKYIDEREPSLKKYLKYKKWYKKRWNSDNRGKQKEGFRTIDERPSIVDKRNRIWDMEVDTIHSSWSERKWGMAKNDNIKKKFLLWW